MTPKKENKTCFYFLEYINNLDSNVNKNIFIELKISFYSY